MERNCVHDTGRVDETVQSSTASLTVVPDMFLRTNVSPVPGTKLRGGQ
jgi:hypothetical protein